MREIWLQLNRNAWGQNFYVFPYKNNFLQFLFCVCVRKLKKIYCIYEISNALIILMAPETGSQKSFIKLKSNLFPFGMIGIDWTFVSLAQYDWKKFNKKAYGKQCICFVFRLFMNNCYSKRMTEENCNFLNKSHVYVNWLFDFCQYSNRQALGSQSLKSQ